MFTSDILDVEEMQITSKDELIEFVYNDTVTYYYEINNCDYPKYSLIVIANYTSPPPDYENVYYVSPLVNKKPVLDRSIYELGMPINFRRPVVLIKGKIEWADSLYEGVTILPVCDSGDKGVLDFSWNIVKRKKQD
jgi:hypothetical protein